MPGVQEIETVEYGVTDNKEVVLMGYPSADVFFAQKLPLHGVR